MIYIVEDDASIRELELYALKSSGFSVEGFDSAQPFYAALKKQLPELIILDIMLPGEDGLSVLKQLRMNQNTQTVPVMMITARGAELDKVKGLDMGADDYITKPYNIPILLARVKAVLRRGGGLAEPDVVEAGGLRLSLTRGTVSADGRTAELSRNELRILAHLMTHAGEIVSRADLIEALWDSQIYIDDNTLSVNVTRLRGKLEALGVPGMIRTRRGMGYQYDGA